MNLRLMGPLLAAATLVGCHNDNNDNGSNPPVPVTMDYSTFVQALIANQTCDNDAPTDLNAIDFTFDANQDAALPVDVSTITTGCTT